MKLGVIADCFKTSLDDALKQAALCGLSGVQVYATSGDFSPEANAIKKDKFGKLLKEYGLELSALCGDLGGHGFEIAEDNKQKVPAEMRIIDLASEFGCPVVTTHIGVIPDDKKSHTYAVMLEAMGNLGLYAKKRGVTLAIETGPETALTLAGFIADTSGGVGVNLDPANFVMVTGQDPVEAVKLLGSHIVHTHAKDGKMLRRTDPKIIYDHFAEGGIEALNVADYFIETRLGEGDVDFKAYLDALRQVGYDGYLTIERETGLNPLADIQTAVSYLKTLI